MLPSFVCCRAVHDSLTRMRAVRVLDSQWAKSRSLARVAARKCGNWRYYSTQRWWVAVRVSQRFFTMTCSNYSPRMDVRVAGASVNRHPCRLTLRYGSEQLAPASEHGNIKQNPYAQLYPPLGCKGGAQGLVPAASSRGVVVGRAAVCGSVRVNGGDHSAAASAPSICRRPARRTRSKSD